MFLHLVAALPEVHLLPHHGPPHAVETPQIVEGSAVEGVLVGAAVLQVGDAVARHELPGGGVERHQVEVGAEQQQHHEREQSQQHGHHQQNPVRPQPLLPAGGRAEARPEDTTELCDSSHYTTKGYIRNAFFSLFCPAVNPNKR